MSATVAVRARGTAATVLARLPLTRIRPLAEPPAGSGLKPVMGDPGFPVLGHSFEFFSDALAVSRRLHAKFGQVAWVNVVGTQLVLVLGPDALETVPATVIKRSPTVRDGTTSSARSSTAA